MKHRQSFVDRRRFLKHSAAALAAPTIVPASALGRDGETAPSNRINLGVVGLGSRGFNLLHEFLAHSDARVTALCDVHKLHYRDLPWGKGPAMGRDAAQDAVAKWFAAGKTSSDPKQLFITDDFREVCDRDNIDAVVVATPDHWHAVCTLTALAAGKDVYCEKPLTHTFAEGQLVYQEVARRKAVFQTGSQQRSDAPFRHVVELVANGHLGKIHRVEVGLPSGYAEPMGDPTVTRARQSTWITTYGAGRPPYFPTFVPGIIAGGEAIEPMAVGYSWIGSAIITTSLIGLSGSTASARSALKRWVGNSQILMCTTRRRTTRFAVLITTAWKPRLPTATTSAPD